MYMPKEVISISPAAKWHRTTLSRYYRLYSLCRTLHLRDLFVLYTWEFELLISLKVDLEGTSQSLPQNLPYKLY